MSKKTNTLLFVLGATVFNILTTIVFFILLVILYSLGVTYLLGPEKAAAAAEGSPILFLVAIVISFFFYRFVLKKFMKKFDMEKNFDPIFGRKQPPKKYTD